MATPLTLRFQTDLTSARSNLVDFAGAVVSHMTRASGALAAGVQNIDRISAAFQRVSGAASAIPQMAAGVAGAVAAYIALRVVVDTVTTAIQAANERFEAIQKIARGAEAGGVGTTFFQGLLGQARALNTEAKTLEGFLTKAREAATVRIGRGDEGPTSSGLTRLNELAASGNISRGDVARYTSAGDQEARIRVVLDLITQLQGKQRDLAAFDLANAFFGSDFEAKLRNGVDIIGAMRRALDGLQTGENGRILTPGEIGMLQQANAELERARSTLADAIAPIQRDIAAYQNQQLVAAKEFEATVLRIAAAFAGLYKYVSAVGDAITALGNANIWKSINDFMASAGLQSFNGMTLVNPDEAEKGSSPLPVRIAPKADRSFNLPKTGGGRSASSGSDIDQVQTFINSLNRANVALRAEVENYSKSNAEKTTAINLSRAEEIARQNNIKLTDAQTEAIRKVSAETANLRDKQADLEQQARQTAEASRYFGQALSDGLADAILEGESLTNVLLSLEKQLARSALQALFTGQGPLAGILGTAPAASAGSNAVGGLAGMFTSLFRANGGPVDAGRAYTVGEMGRELFIPNQNGRIVPIERGTRGMGSPVSIDMGGTVLQINQPGASIGEIRAMMAARDAENRRTIGQQLANWRENN